MFEIQIIEKRILMCFCVERFYFYGTSWNSSRKRQCMLYALRTEFVRFRLSFWYTSSFNRYILPQKLFVHWHGLTEPRGCSKQTDNGPIVFDDYDDDLLGQVMWVMQMVGFDGFGETHVVVHGYIDHSVDHRHRRELNMMDPFQRVQTYLHHGAQHHAQFLFFPLLAELRHGHLLIKS